MADQVTIRDPLTVEEMRARYRELQRKCFTPAAASEVSPYLAEPVVDNRSFIPPKAFTPEDFVFDGAINGRLCLRLVCIASGVTLNEIRSGRRLARLVKARQLFFWLCHKFTSLSYPQIGRLSGGHDHSTVIYACRKVDKIIEKAGLDFTDDVLVMVHRLWSADWPVMAR